jgi:hypothetical protein
VAAAAAAAALFLLAAEAPAQVRDDLLREIERTDQVIDKARMVVEGSNDALSSQYLDQAIKLQDLAKTALAADRLLDAGRLTRQARDRAFTALRVAEQSGSAEFILFTLDRTDALLDYISPIVRESGLEMANRQLDLAYEQQRRAREAQSSGRPRVAVSVSMQSRERAHSALRLAEGDSRLSPERVRRHLERTRELIRESAWLEEAGERAARTYGLAVRQLEDAEARLEAGDVEGTARQGRRARDLLLQALNQADRPLEMDRVEAALERARAAVEDAAGKAASEEQRAAVERARGHLARAEEHLRAERLAPAVADLQAVRRILESAGF